MAQKFDVISELYDRACLEIITDPVKWQSFLQTAGRNFKLRFDEQFLLFIQRPDATAVTVSPKVEAQASKCCKLFLTSVLYCK